MVPHDFSVQIQDGHIIKNYDTYIYTIYLFLHLSLKQSLCLFIFFRAIYDGDEHQKFMERLDARIKTHDRDIERMCNFHYQGFIDSIRELLQVRSQAKKLNVSIQ